MRLPSLAIASKLVIRNKRRFAIVTGGTIFALAVLGAVFLTAQGQARSMGVAMIQGFQPPVSIQMYEQNTTVNILNDIDALIALVDENSPPSIIDHVEHDIVLPMDGRFGLVPWNDGAPVDWASAHASAGAYQDALVFTRDAFPVEGDTPAPRSHGELVVSLALATATGLGVNDTVRFVNYLTNTSTPAPWTITGVLQDTHRLVHMTYPGFTNMTAAVASWDTAFHVHVATFQVFVDLDQVDIFTVSSFVSRVGSLTGRIGNAARLAGLDVHVQNVLASFIPDVYLILFSLFIFGLFFALLAPVVLLSNYVSTTINFEVFDRREGEFAQFRSRGFAHVQMAKILGAEIVVTAALVAAGSGTLAVGLSYLLDPVVSAYQLFPGTRVSFTPFPGLEAAIFFIVFMIAMSLLFVLLVYQKPMRAAFQKEMIDTIKAHVREHRRRKEVLGAIAFMLVAGGAAFALYVAFMVSIGGAPPLYDPTAFFQPILSVFLVLAPFFIAFGLLKLLAEKAPDRFARFCTILVPRAGTALRHLVTRNISSKAPRVAKIAMIVAFCVGFAMMVNVSKASLERHGAEKDRLLLGADLQVLARGGSPWDLGDIASQVTVREKVSTTASIVETRGFLANMTDPVFTWTSFSFHFTNFSAIVNACEASLPGKYLVDVSPGDLTGMEPGALLLPAIFKSRVSPSQTHVNLSLSYTKVGWDRVEVTRACRIAGYFKGFPGVVIPPRSAYYDLPVVLNLDFWSIFNVTANVESYDMKIIVRTIFDDPLAVEAAAPSIASGAGPYVTLANVSTPTNPLALDLGRNPLLFGLLEVDYWLVIFISVFGIGTLVAMKVTSERREIGLFRIRGYDGKMIHHVQLNEKYMPVLVGALMGLATGIAGGIILTHVLSSNLMVFNPVIDIPVDLVFDPVMLVTIFALPACALLAVVLVAVRVELKQDLGSIMDEGD